MKLEDGQLVAFVATTQPEAARRFYCQILGLRLEEENPFALVLKSSNAELRLQKVETFTPSPFTTLGWKVEDISATIAELKNKGVKFERFEGVLQDGQGVWVAPGGARVSWFKDPDGNLLSLSQNA